MHVFAFWKGSDADQLRATGVAAHGTRWECYPVGSMHAVVVFAHHPDDRIAIDALHPSLMVFPGPNGKLKQQHVDHIAKDFPQAKEGDAFRTVLSALYDQYGTEVFNPDAY